MSSQTPHLLPPRSLFYRWSAIASLGLAIVAVPLLEVAHGRFPGRQTDGPRSFDDVLQGPFARRVEKSTEADSALLELVGPRYRQLMAAMFRVGNPEVHFGLDDWLFLAASVHDYPPKASADLLPKVVHALANIVRSFEKHGTRVIIVLVPDKSVVAPEKIGGPAMDTQAPYESVLSEMRAAGLSVIDPRNTLREGDVIYYGRTDTHWTPEGALRVARATGRQARSMFPNGVLPGEPYEATLEFRDQIDAESDLQSLLRLPEGSSTWRRYLNAWRPVVVLDTTTHQLVEDRSIRDIVNGGTSFSESTNFPGLLSATLGRRVQDLTAPGMPISFPAVSLVEQILFENRSWPKLLVWEMPDRLFYLYPEQTRSPLEHAQALLTYDVKGGIPISPDTISGYIEARRDGARITYKQSGIRCYFEYEPSEPIPANGTYAFACFVSGPAASRCTLQFDTGSGFTNNRVTVLLGPTQPYHVVFPLVAGDQSKIRAIRFQPSVTTSEVTFDPPVLARRRE